MKTNVLLDQALGCPDSHSTGVNRVSAPRMSADAAERSAQGPRRPFRRTGWGAWILLSLIGAILVEDPSKRLLLRAEAQESEAAATAPDPAQANPGQATPKAEVEDAKEAAEALGEGGADSPGGFHLNLNPGGGEVVRIGSNAHLRKGDKARQVVVVFGDGAMEGEVEGDMVVVFGDAMVDGPVNGDFVNVMGSTKLGPNARLEGDCVVVGGKLERDPGAQLKREPVEVSFGILFGWLKPVGYWLKTGLLLARPLPATSGLAWVMCGLHFGIYLIILLLMPKPVDVCVKTLQTQALPAFLAGLLALLLVGPLVAILLASGVGILIVPLVWLAMLAAMYVGKTAVLQFMGGQLLERFNPESGTRSLSAFLIGSVLVTLLYMVPLLGFVVYGVLLPLGLGAALMAAFASFRRNGSGRPAPVPTTAVPMAALVPGGGLPTGEAVVAGGESGGGEAGLGLTPALAGASASELAVLPRVGFWLRLGATALDFLLFCWLIPATGPLFLLAWFGYHVGMWTWKGTTIGGIVCGLKIVRIDGREVDFGVALVRSLGSVLSFMALCLGFFWAGWSTERQAWHDTIAGTTIVKMPKGVSLI